MRIRYLVKYVNAGGEKDYVIINGNLVRLSEIKPMVERLYPKCTLKSIENLSYSEEVKLHS